MPRDHYEVLGVPRSATTEEITKTYKKLARQHHPDRNPGDKQAEVRFKEIQNAYDILSDQTKRKQYDQFGHDGPQMGGAGGPGGFHFGGPGGASVDPEVAEELYRKIFGNAGGGGGGGFSFEDLLGGAGGGGRASKGRGRRHAAPPPENVEVETSIPFETSAQGGSISLRVGERKIDVKVPAGIESGQKLRVSGQGPGGGDINVRITIEPHAFFRREGKDILLDVPISIGEALIGGKVDVPTIDGRRVEVKIRPGTSSGAKSRLPGLGIAGGDQYLVFKIVAPKGGVKDDHSKGLIEEFAKLHPYDPRADAAWK
ncbi:MAG: DnaJ domain-containing protein [Planctomycetes bacterium]|nr:DnaJ domain-containing protein [Planctomycetota bacterium]